MNNKEKNKDLKSSEKALEKLFQMPEDLSMENFDEYMKNMISSFQMLAKQMKSENKEEREEAALMMKKVKGELEKQAKVAFQTVKENINTLQDDFDDLSDEEQKLLEQSKKALKSVEKQLDPKQKKKKQGPWMVA